MKKFFSFKLISSLLIIIGLTFCYIVIANNTPAKKAQNDIVGIIGNNTITYDEVLMYATQNKTVVGESFAKENNIESYGSSFWSTAYNGKSPLDSLAESILTDLIYANTLREETSKYGISTEVDFLSAKKKWSTLNDKNGTNLSLFDYINNTISNEENQLKEKLFEEKKPSEATLEKAYASLDDDYKREDFKLTGIEFKFIEGQTESILASLVNISSNTDNEDEIVENLSSLYPNCIIKSFSINSQEIQKEDLYNLSIAEVLFNKNKNELVEGIQEEQYFYILTKEGGNLLTYHQAPELGKNKYINDLFDKHMLKATTTIKTEFSQSIYDILVENATTIF